MKVVFALCSYDGKVVADFVSSYTRTILALNRRKIGVAELWLTGHAYLHLARDILCHAFLTRTDGSHLMQIDSDLGWEDTDVIKLLDHGKDFVAGVYCVKQPEPKFMVNPYPGPHGALVKCHGAPGGFTLVAREAFEKMKSPDIVFEDRRFPGEAMYGFHSGGVSDGKYWGEDMAFCRRWSAHGDVWVDPTIHLRHWEGTKCYAHRFEDAIRGDVGTV